MRISLWIYMSLFDKRGSTQIYEESLKLSIDNNISLSKKGVREVIWEQTSKRINLHNLFMLVSGKMPTHSKQMHVCLRGCMWMYTSSNAFFFLFFFYLLGGFTWKLNMMMTFILHHSEVKNVNKVMGYIIKWYSLITYKRSSIVLRSCCPFANSKALLHPATFLLAVA